MKTSRAKTESDWNLRWKTKMNEARLTKSKYAEVNTTQSQRMDGVISYRMFRRIASLVSAIGSLPIRPST